MGFALISLMAYMLCPTGIAYMAAIALLRGNNLEAPSKIVGFLIALPSAAIASLIFSPAKSVASAESMILQGAISGALIGAAVVLLIGKRKRPEEEQQAN